MNMPQLILGELRPLWRPQLTPVSMRQRKNGRGFIAVNRTGEICKK